MVNNMIKDFNIPDNFITVKEASTLLNVDKKIIYDDIKYNKLYANVINNKFYIKKESLDSYSKLLNKRNKIRNILWVISGVSSLFLITGLILISTFYS